MRETLANLLTLLKLPNCLIIFPLLQWDQVTVKSIAFLHCVYAVVALL